MELKSFVSSFNAEKFGVRRGKINENKSIKTQDNIIKLQGPTDVTDHTIWEWKRKGRELRENKKGLQLAALLRAAVLKVVICCHQGRGAYEMFWLRSSSECLSCKDIVRAHRVLAWLMLTVTNWNFSQTTSFSFSFFKQKSFIHEWKRRSSQWAGRDSALTLDANVARSWFVTGSVLFCSRSLWLALYRTTATFVSSSFCVALFNYVFLS